jgi:glycosyltransferase involved in cell wall biosynthesis
MRILFNALPTHCQGGGALVKLRKLEEHFRARGHRVDFYDPWETDIESYDIYHHFSFFKWDLPMIQYAKATGVKVVVETMYWWSWKYAFFYPQPTATRLRAIVHHGVKTFAPWLAPQRKVAVTADLLMANSRTEARLLARHFAVSRDKIAVIPNGADARFREASRDRFIEKYGLKDFVLVVGMFELRKNQLAVIRALKNTEIPVVFIGTAPPPHRWYYELCRREATRTMRFLDHIDHNDPLLASTYAAADTLVMPSWHETVGKVALEAGLAGAKLVLTTFSPVREYFGDLARYVAPGDDHGIRKAILESMASPKDPRIREHLSRDYLWDRVADLRLKAYAELTEGDGVHRPACGDGAEVTSRTAQLTGSRSEGL